MYRITFLNGPAEGRRLTVRTGSVRIGRGPDCAVRVSDPAMAERHADVEERDGALWIRNLDPLHGLEIDGQRMAETETRLAGKERLKIGSTLVRIEPLHEPHRVSPRRVTGLQAWAVVSIIALVLGQSLLIVFLARLYDRAPTAHSPAPAHMESNLEASVPADATSESALDDGAMAEPPSPP